VFSRRTAVLSGICAVLAACGGTHRSPRLTYVTASGNLAAVDIGTGQRQIIERAYGTDPETTYDEPAWSRARQLAATLHDGRATLTGPAEPVR